MSSHHCHEEHSGGHDHDHDHDHSNDIQPALQYSLYQHIDFDNVTCLNESESRTCQAIVKKTWTQRLENEPVLESDADEQLLIYIPFTGQVKLHSILVRSSDSGSAPQTLKIFINRDDMDFSMANDLSPIQEIKLPKTSEVLDTQLKRALFGNVQSITLFIQDNYGDQLTQINYLGFKGDWMQLGRAPTNILYEAAANPRDHALKGTSINKIGSNFAGSGKEN